MINKNGSFIDGDGSKCQIFIIYSHVNKSIKLMVGWVSKLGKEDGWSGSSKNWILFQSIGYRKEAKFVDSLNEVSSCGLYRGFKFKF